MKLALVFVFVAAMLTAGEPPPPSPLAGVDEIAVYVMPMAPEIAELGMPSEVIGAEVVARVKEAGIQLVGIDATVAVPDVPTLRVDVLTLAQEGVDQVIYSVRVEFVQTVRLDRDPGVVLRNVPTWSIGGVALATNEWRKTMIADVLSFTDEFIAAYQAANPAGTGH